MDWAQVLEIQQVLSGYFRALDERNFDVAHLQRLFTPDAKVVRPNGAETVGPEAIGASLAASMARFSATQHLLLVPDVVLDGDAATARANSSPCTSGPRRRVACSPWRIASSPAAWSWRGSCGRPRAGGFRTSRTAWSDGAAAGSSACSRRSEPGHPGRSVVCGIRSTSVMSGFSFRKLTQAAFRVGDGPVNLLTPLMPHFPLVLIFCRRSVTGFGMGSLMALVLPFGITYLILQTTMLLFWWEFGLPLGIGSTYTYP